MPRLRVRIGMLMAVVAVAGLVLALIAYRQTLPSLDDGGGGRQGLVIIAVDIGFGLGVPALLVLGPLLWVAHNLLKRLHDWHALHSPPHHDEFPAGTSDSTGSQPSPWDPFD